MNGPSMVRMPDHAERGPVNPPWSGDDSKVGVCGLRRAFLHIAEPDRAQPRNQLAGLLQGSMAIRHSAACGYKALERLCELLESCMTGCSGDPAYGASPDHSTLEFGNFLESGLDRVLDRTHLRGDFESG